MSRLLLYPLDGVGPNPCLRLLGLAMLVTAGVIAGGALCNLQHPLQQIRSLQASPLWPEDPSVFRGKAEVPQPVLTAKELLTLQYYARRSRTYLEWGSGGSTFLVAPMAEHAWSIDNNKEWCDSLLKDQVSIRFWQANKVINYTCVDTGPTRAWGYPTAEATDEQMRAYPDAIDSLGVDSFDMVLIDGRFRVACGLKALHYITPSSVVMVHDWKPRRKQYSPLLQFYDVVQEADKLMVMRRKTDWDPTAAAAKLQHFYKVKN